MLCRTINKFHLADSILVVAGLIIIAFGLTSERAVAEGVVATDTKKNSFDFTPRHAGQLFNIPKDVWSSLNQFVFLIAFDEYAPGETHLELNARARELSGFSELYAACRVWGNETFETLQTLATEISSGAIKELLSRLQAVLQRMYNDSGDARYEFEQITDNLNRRLIALSDLSERVNQQLMTLYKFSNVMMGEYKRRGFPESPWVSIGPKLEDVQNAMSLMVGRWNALTSDLNYLRKILVAPGSSGIPDLYDLDIDIGLTAWDKVIQDAKVFVSNASEKRKYLFGENYYEECPLNERSWYVMKNLFLNDKGYVLTAQRQGNPPLQMKTRASDNNFQEWQFQRLGKGWWRVVNRVDSNIPGNPYLLLLDGSKSDPVRINRTLVGQGRQLSYGQWWRCLSTTTQGSGWFRLINAALGEMYALDTHSDSYGAFMGNLNLNYSGQYWRFEPAGGQ